MQAAIFEAEPGQIDTWMRGELTSEEIIAPICQECGLDPQEVLHELMVSCQQMQFVSAEIPDLVAHIRRRGVKVVIATDNMDTFSRWTVPEMRLLEMFDGVLNSYDLKGLKYDRNEQGGSIFFDDFLQANGIKAGESLLIDDGNEQYGAIIQQFGVDYRRIEPGVGLLPALQEIVASLL
jgi:phosphoserine phosphatase